MAAGDAALNSQPFGEGRPRFGELAARLGVPAAAIESSLAEQRASGGRLGQLLVQRRVLAPEQVSAILERQAHWTATAVWQELKARLPCPTSLSLCLPAYNEERAIGDTLRAALAILPKFVERLEVIVVDDGSRDQTAARVNEWINRDNRVRLISHSVNRGYGAAVTSGLHAATGELVMFADSDGQFDFLDAAALLARLQDHDLTIGYRWQRAETGLRRLNAWAWGMLVKLVLGVRVRDLDCAFKLFRRETLARLQLTSTGACINAEIMIQCAQAGMHYVELPVRHYPRVGGTATGSKASVIARAFRELPQLRRYRRTGPISEPISGPHWRRADETALQTQERTRAANQPRSGER